MTGICQIDYTASPPGRVCQSCTDGVRGGEETDVDCGGSGCEPCNADGTRKRALHFTLPFLAFLRSKARAFHYCTAFPFVSAYKARAFHYALPFLVFPPSEATRAFLPSGFPNGPQTCLIARDCRTQNCFEGTCISHFNGIRDGDESDADCGGVLGATCAQDQGCVSGDDCRTGICGDDSICRTLSAEERCSNSAMDGSETAVDCGGSLCSRLGFLCGIGEACSADSDCAAGNCHPEDGCVSCQNSLADGDDSRWRDCHSAVPPSTFSRCINSDGERASAK